MKEINNIDKTKIECIINSFNPDIEEWVGQKTIMSIVGIDHSENTWSNIYAYFLDEKESGTISLTFIRSLENIIFQKTGKMIRLSKCRVSREVKTIKGNRIDLLIHASDHSIIIENKVYHNLVNDLDDYWLSVDGNDDCKTGIVLTLSNILTNNPHYINITHLEWMLEVERKLAESEQKMNIRTSLLLKDFINNIKQVSNKMNENNLRFYLKNRVQINSIYFEVTNYRNWLQSVFTDRNFIESLGNFTLVHNDWVGCKNRFAMYQIESIDSNELVVTVYYERLWNSQPGEARLCFYVQALGAWLKKALNNEMEIRRIVSAAGFQSMRIEKDFWHCMGVEIPVSEEQLSDQPQLKGYIAQYLHGNTKFMAAAKEILNLLKNN